MQAMPSDSDRQPRNSERMVRCMVRIQRQPNDRPQVVTMDDAFKSDEFIPGTPEHHEWLMDRLGEREYGQRVMSVIQARARIMAAGINVKNGDQLITRTGEVIPMKECIDSDCEICDPSCLPHVYFQEYSETGARGVLTEAKLRATFDMIKERNRSAKFTDITNI